MSIKLNFCNSLAECKSLYISWYTYLYLTVCILKLHETSCFWSVGQLSNHLSFRCQLFYNYFSSNLHIFSDVCYFDLLYELKENLLIPYYLVIKSYLHNRTFYVKCRNAESDRRPIRVGVPQDNLFGPVFIILYMALTLTPQWWRRVAILLPPTEIFKRN